MIGRCFTENVYKEVDFHYLPRCLSIKKKNSLEHIKNTNDLIRNVFYNIKSG